MAIDLLLDENDDIQFDANGELVFGESSLQDVGLIVRMNQGELKSDPILGPNLIEMIKSSASRAEMIKRIKLHLERDGKSYEDFENLVELILKDHAGIALT